VDEGSGVGGEARGVAAGVVAVLGECVGGADGVHCR